MKTRILLVVLFALVAAVPGAVHGQAQPPAPQQPPLTFRAEVNYVEVDARVLDAQGKFVTDLKPEDFEVFEDRRPQKVTAFSLVNIPVERQERPLFASKPIEPDVRNNLQGADGRIYLLILDDLHTTALRSQRTKLAARMFIERYIGANDLAAVIHTGGRSDASQDFTNNQRLLLQAVDKFMGRKLRSSTLNKIDDVSQRAGTGLEGDPARDLDDKERGFQARNTLETIRNVAQYLGNIRGRRKAIVMFSEGIDYNIYDIMSINNTGNTEATVVMDATRDMLAAATRANVAIYGVDPRGLGASFDNMAEIQSFPDDTSLGLTQSALLNETRLGQDSLRTMSEETGGFAVVNRNDFQTAFQRIVDDNSSYYVMGYYSTNDRRDGRFRRIEVRVKDRPGLVVRARKGYVAPRGRAPETKTAAAKDAPSAELKEALESPLPLPALPMAITAAVFKGPAAKGSVVISTFVHGGSLPFAEEGGMFKNDLEVVGIATDDKGKAFNTDRNTVNLNMKPDTVNRVRATGFRMIQSLDLQPGRYLLRVAVREGNTRKAGMATFDLEVPDFTKAPLTMSSVALTSAMSGAAPTIRPKDPLEKLLPGPLTTYREFPQIDELALFTEIYDNVKQAHKTEIVATVKAEGGQSVFETRESHDSSELAGSAGGYGFQARVPLKGMAPGLYVLRIEATAGVGDRPTVSRETVFRVAPAPAEKQ
jgi:VWFA-related protein